MHRLNRFSIITKHSILLALITLILSSCAAEQPPNPEPSTTPIASQPTPLPQAEVVFSVTIPDKSPSADSVYVDILDEVTGLALNPLRYQMEAKTPTQFEAHVPVASGSTIKYRFIRGSNPPAIEYTSTGTQVRYRVYSVTGPTTIQDTVVAWNDLPFQGKTGRVQGKVLDASTGEPVPGMLIECAGRQTFSAGDGSFRFDHMPTGIHTVAAISLDGLYHPNQQGAEITTDTGTPAILQVEKTDTVKVTFVVSIPDLPADNAAVRLIGNLYQLGDTFSDLSGGMNTLASRAPSLSRLPDGRYSLIVQLPAGFDLRYKYSLGDGFWNAEHSPDGKFMVRQLIVPSTDTVIEDRVSSWESSESEPASFSLRVPPTTPKNETMSIQFNPFGWTEPVPMWPAGENTWTYVLYNPIQLGDQIEYRYCRNDLCDSTAQSPDRGTTTHTISFSSRSPQTFEDSINAWSNWGEPPEPTKVMSGEIKPRDASFVAGVELATGYDPSWLPYMKNSIDQIRQLGGNAVILTPTWTLASPDTPVLEPVAGKDMLWQDKLQVGEIVKEKGLGVIIYPTISMPVPTTEWWSSARRDIEWWQTWFDSYSTFILDAAEYANLVDARGLVLGGPAVSPALPGSLLTADNPSGVPGDMTQRWDNLIDEVRSRFHGTLYWSISAAEVSQPPALITKLDALYVLWSPSLVSTEEAANRPLNEEFGRLLDETLAPVHQNTGKPVYIAIDYPSIVGATKGCVEIGDQCQPFDSFSTGKILEAEPALDLQTQVDLYNAAFDALNQRDWMSGFISRGYEVPVALRDRSSSIHGKPAWDVVWYWYPRLLGKNK